MCQFVPTLVYPNRVRNKMATYIAYESHLQNY